MERRPYRFFEDFEEVVAGAKPKRATERPVLSSDVRLRPLASASNL